MSNDEDLLVEIEATNNEFYFREHYRNHIGRIALASNKVIRRKHNYDKWTYNVEHYDFSRRREDSITYDIKYP